MTVLDEIELPKVIQELSEAAKTLEKKLKLDEQDVFKTEAIYIANNISVETQKLMADLNRLNSQPLKLITPLLKGTQKIKELEKKLAKLAPEFGKYELAEYLINSFNIKTLLVAFVICYQGTYGILDEAKKRKSKINKNSKIELIFKCSCVLESEKDKFDNFEKEEDLIFYSIYFISTIVFLNYNISKIANNKNKGFGKNNTLLTEKEKEAIGKTKQNLVTTLYSLIGSIKKKTQEDVVIDIKNISWGKYKYFTQSLTDISWCRLSYFRGILELLVNGEKHENIKGNIGDLIVYYCDEKEIDYHNFGSITQSDESEEVSKEPDVSYGFNGNKKIVDLAVEVNLSSGSHKDLEKYKVFKTKEVWMWNVDSSISFFVLGDNNEYSEISTSYFLNNLTTEIIQHCVILMREQKAITGKKKMIKMVKELELNT